MKDFAFRQGLRNIWVLGPWSSLRKLGNTMWEDDQVHINKEGFNTLAELISTCASESRGMEAGGSSRLPKTPSSEGPSGSSDRRLYSGHREGGAVRGGEAAVSATNVVAGLQQYQGTRDGALPV